MFTRPHGGLVREDLERELADVSLVRRIYFFEELPSTSDWAKDLVRRAGPGASLHGTLVIANHQTAGRGRFHRSWESPAGVSLLFTLVITESQIASESTPSRDLPQSLFPPPARTEITHTPPIQNSASVDRLLVAGAPVAVCEAVAAATGLNAQIKYPNDILIGSAKVGGILIERVFSTASSEPCYLVGIGLNVNQSPTDLPPTARLRPTSLALEAERPFELVPLLRTVLLKLHHLLSTPHQVYSRLAGCCNTIGRAITIRTPQGFIEGTALAFRPEDGALIVRLDSGADVAVLSGDVELVEMIHDSTGESTLHPIPALPPFRESSR